jgi:hypothetical protein
MMCSRSQAFTNRAQGSCPAPGHAVPNSPSRPCSRKTVAARVWQQTQPSVAQQHQTPALNLLDAAMGAMLAMLDGGAAPAKNNPRCVARVQELGAAGVRACRCGGGLLPTDRGGARRGCMTLPAHTCRSATATTPRTPSCRAHQPLRARRPVAHTSHRAHQHPPQRRAAAAARAARVPGGTGGAAWRRPPRRRLGALAHRRAPCRRLPMQQRQRRRPVGVRRAGAASSALQQRASRAATEAAAHRAVYGASYSTQTRTHMVA